MHNRTAVATTMALIVGMTLVLSTTAAGAETRRVRYSTELAQNVVMTGFCDFTVHVTDTGTPFTAVETYDAEGTLVRIDFLPSGPFYTTYEANGNTVTVHNSGPVTLIFNDDGTITAYQRGQSVTGDQGLVTDAAFLTHTTGRVVTIGTFNETTGHVDFSSVTWLGNVTDLCEALAA